MAPTPDLSNARLLRAEGTGLWAQQGTHEPPEKKWKFPGWALHLVPIHSPESVETDIFPPCSWLCVALGPGRRAVYQTPR